MYKLLALLGVLAVVIVIVVWKNELSISHTGSQGSPEKIIPVNSQETVLGLSAEKESSETEWTVLEFNKLSISIKVPKDVTYQEFSDSLEIASDSIKINVSSHPLPEIETVNTVAEKDITQKSLTLGEKFSLKEPIEPIAISSVTGIVYTSLESDKEITYIYVPREHSYILIENLTDTYSPWLSTSDLIVYSLKLL